MADASPDPLSILKNYFGHSSFRGSQRDVIDHILRGGHSLVIMPTGMGKSICYQIPALINANTNDARNLTLVVSPLIALMKDQVDALKSKGVDAAFINSSLRRDERLLRYSAVERGDYTLLYVTPERFRKRDFVSVIETRNVNLLAVDEAHCISDWGHDFRPDYTRLGDIRKLLGNPTTIALTATATPDVQRDIVKQLGLGPADVKLFHEGIDRPNLTLDVVDVWDDDDKMQQIARIMKECPGSGIIYFTLIKTLSEFSDRLTSNGIMHLVYHGDLERNQRRIVQDQFMTEPDHLVLATNAFGMGIDKENIRFVVHADVPGSMESYYQEIGRAGRDGQPSACVLLYDERDLATQIEFLEWSNPDIEYYARVYDFLKHDRDQANAFGIDWLRERLNAKRKHDRRLETVLTMFDRYGVIEGSLAPLDVNVLTDLPQRLRDGDYLEQKHKRDNEKLYALVRYAKHNGDRKEFIHQYFGISDDRRMDSLCAGVSDQH